MSAIRNNCPLIFLFLLLISCKGLETNKKHTESNNSDSRNNKSNSLAMVKNEVQIPYCFNYPTELFEQIYPDDTEPTETQLKYKKHDIIVQIFGNASRISEFESLYEYGKKVIKENSWILKHSNLQENTMVLGYSNNEGIYNLLKRWQINDIQKVTLIIKAKNEYIKEVDELFFEYFDVANTNCTD